MVLVLLRVFPICSLRFGRVCVSSIWYPIAASRFSRRRRLTGRGCSQTISRTSRTRGRKIPLFDDELGPHHINNEMCVPVMVTQSDAQKSWFFGGVSVLQLESLASFGNIRESLPHTVCLRGECNLEAAQCAHCGRCYNGGARDRCPGI